MAVANPWWKRALSGLWASIKAQPLATGLFLPLLVAVVVLGFQVKIARDDAREARVQSINVDRLSKIQDSGKALDLALAAYFQSVSELGLAEQHLRMPGTYTDITVSKAQTALIDTRVGVRKALADHASDVQRLRGSLDPIASDRYMSALADIDATVEGDASISRTGANITALGKLVVARNALVDQGMKKVS